MDKTAKLIQWQRIAIGTLFLGLMVLSTSAHLKIEAAHQALTRYRFEQENAVRSRNNAIYQNEATTREAKGIVQQNQDIRRQLQRDKEIIRDLNKRLEQYEPKPVTSCCPKLTLKIVSGTLTGQIVGRGTTDQ